ncbi:transcriptional regulator [Glaciihabitans sp. UYNi722]|uniref:transcriptional regulator n=1 Tax=Glaciihabitans sp. UYNi722 TaxID=3156344 RepID=UPI0033978E17
MDELDPVIHAQARLRVVTVLDTLGVGDSIAFPRLQDVLEMTSGNLATHLRKLEDAGYVTVTKAHAGRSPVTYLGLSPEGRTAFRAYRVALMTLLEASAS